MSAMNTLKVGGMSLGGSGVIGATGYGAYALIQPTNIEEKLKRDGKDVLPASDEDKSRDQDWEALVEKYEADSSTEKIENVTLITSTKGSTERTNNIKKLKEACKKLLETKLSDDSDESKYQKAEKWCTKSAVETEST